MANTTTHLAFNITATREDAERFIKLVEAAVAIEDGQPLLLAPEIEPAFRSVRQPAERILVEILEGMDLGIDCRFDEDHGVLGFWDNDGSPNLWAFAQCLQRLFPDKLPMGFVYSNDCDRHRPSGFGGGLFAIGADDIIHRTLDRILEEELAQLQETSGGN